MSNKNKNETVSEFSEKVTDISQRLGLSLMTLAATVGMIELPNHLNGRIVLPNQPVYVRVADNAQANNPLRREREENVTHYISYSVAQRTPSRSGKH
jgi:hypothetical protein